MQGHIFVFPDARYFLQNTFSFSIFFIVDSSILRHIFSGYDNKILAGIPNSL